MLSKERAWTYYRIVPDYGSHRSYAFVFHKLYVSKVQIRQTKSTERLFYADGISANNPVGARVWQIPFGFQLVPAGIMAIGLIFVRESPRYLASRGRVQEALNNLAYYRKRHIDSDEVRYEMAEIEAAIEEERAVREGLGIREAFFGKGNFIRFVIAFVIFLLQQWSGQNSVSYYAPQIFTSVSISMVLCFGISHCQLRRLDTSAARTHSSLLEFMAS